MTADEFYVYFKKKLISEYKADTCIHNVMWDIRIRDYYFKRFNQSYGSSIKGYVRYLRKVRLDIYPDAPSISRRVKLNGVIGEFTTRFNRGY
mgnify:CR=1 FL=1